MESHKFIISSTPHIRSGDTIQGIMRDVLIALAPATLMGFWFFGFKAILITVLSVASCMGFEYLYQKFTKKDITVLDLSAAVTGLLLALNLPANTAWWVPIIGSLFAIIVVKQLFGGLGQNFMNPALGARAFLVASYPEELTRWAPVDAVASATPLTAIKEGVILSPTVTDYINAFIGNVNGCIGEVSALAIIIGGLYLIYKKIITWHVPVTFIGTVFVLSFILGRNGLFTGYPLYEILIGGVMLGGFFMATDYSSSPVTSLGKLIMGFGCGFITVIIRLYGNYPEGMSFAILLMNLCVPLIDRYTRPKVFGVKKEVKNNG